MRNLADRPGGFREMARVVRPGGRVVCLEMSQPPGWAAPFAHVWTDRAVPVLGKVLAGDGDAYTYLPESARAFPGAPSWPTIMRDAGLDHGRVTGG